MQIVVRINFIGLAFAAALLTMRMRIRLGGVAIVYYYPHPALCNIECVIFRSNQHHMPTATNAATPLPPTTQLIFHYPFG